MNLDPDDDFIALASVLIAKVQRLGGQLAADGQNVLVVLPDHPEALLLLEAVKAGRPWLLAVLHGRQCMHRAAYFARGCKWRRKPVFRASVPPPMLRRLKGAQAAAGGPESGE